MDRWYRVAVPILEYVDENGDSDDSLSVGQIAAGTGLGPYDVSTALESLCEAGYLAGELRKYIGSSPSSWNLFRCCLSERGLRAVDAWPSDNSYDPLIELIERQTELIERQTELIERQIAATPKEEPLPQRAMLGNSFTDIGKATFAGLLVQVDQQRVSFQAHVGLNPLGHLSRNGLVSVVNNIRSWLHPGRRTSDSTFHGGSNRVRVRPVLSPASPGPHVDSPIG